MFPAPTHSARVLLVFALLLTALRVGAAPETPPRTTPACQTNAIEGWTVHVRRELLADEPAATEAALGLLRRQLADIVRLVPAPAVTALRRVPLYFSPEYPDHRPTAEFHPDAGWLRENGRDPAMAQGIEFTNIRRFAAETDRMPLFALHELAHAYHFRELPRGFANPEIEAAYQRAKASGTYDRVERHFGSGKPATFERAYALTNAMEYFAETTEAFFGRNDFFPFTRDELKAHDPRMFELLAKLWGADSPPSAR